MPSEACAEELETLNAIFLNEIELKEETMEGEIQMSMILYPATADDEESRYVTLTLELTLPPNYPKLPPKILFRNPRGLNDEMLQDLMKNMKERCDDRLESQMIYELIDMCKEFLTKNNRPASECPICLFSFTEFDVFYRTLCFHHFHSQCLGNYLKNLAASFKEDDNVLKEKQELTCPVCRERLDDDIDIDKLVESPPPAEELQLTGGGASKVLNEWEGKKKVLKQIYDKQKNQGGIIDLTETKRMLVISSPVDRDNESQGGASNNGTSSAQGASTVNDSTKQHRGDCRQKNKIPVNSHGKSGGGGGHRAPQNCSDQNAASCGSSKTIAKSVPESESQSETKEEAHSDSKHQNGRCRRGGGGYNNRRRNK